MIKLTHLRHFHALTQRLYEYQYQFDAAGNRTQMDYFDGSVTQTTYYPLYNEANQLKNRNVGSNQYTYEYDANGNMTWEKLGQNNLRNFVWNADNRMTEAINYGTGYEYYAYDALGRRIARSSTGDGICTLYFYDGLTVIAEKVQEEGDPWYWSRIFTVGPGVIGNIFRISTNNGSSWSDVYYHYDAIGNVALRTNSSGIVESIDQEAYGNVKIGSQSGYHLTTKEYDSLPELYYFNARWYDSIIGRFISKSPLSVRAEHPYNFCNGNPATYIDSSGLLSRFVPPGTCPSTEYEAYEQGFCLDWGFMSATHEGDLVSWRQVTTAGTPGLHCIYHRTTHLIATQRDNIWAEHSDDHNPVEYRDCIGFCAYSNWWTPLHYILDTLPSNGQLGQLAPGAPYYDP